VSATQTPCMLKQIRDPRIVPTGDRLRNGTPMLMRYQTGRRDAPRVQSRPATLPCVHAVPSGVAGSAVQGARQWQAGSSAEGSAVRGRRVCAVARARGLEAGGWQAGAGRQVGRCSGSRQAKGRQEGRQSSFRTSAHPERHLPRKHTSCPTQVPVHSHPMWSKSMCPCTPGENAHSRAAKCAALSRQYKQRSCRQPAMLPRARSARMPATCMRGSATKCRVVQSR